MSFETREEILEKVMAMPRPKCPHCGVEMSLWEEPPMRFGDGLGWGTPYLFVCFNDECPYFVRGWDWMWKDQGVKASYRHRLDPATGTTGPLPAWSNDAHKDQIIDE